MVDRSPFLSSEEQKQIFVLDQQRQSQKANRGRAHRNSLNVESPKTKGMPPNNNKWAPMQIEEEIQHESG
jgi:hypothetical protein